MRDNMLPYGRQSIDEADIQAVVEVLQSDWLTTGPTVEAFEEAFATQAGCAHAVALSNGTAALHAAMFALGIGPGDEVIVPAMTFVATANCVAYQGGKPVFADVLPDSLLIDPDSVAQHITPRTRAIIAVDYAGQPCDYDRLRRLSDQHGLALAADACHAVGGSYKGRAVGSLADLSTFSFHPVKHMTTGEGGAVTTDLPELAQRMRLFRNHGITSDHRQRAAQGSWFYEMVELGYNYRISDIQCALGLSQLARLERWVTRRQAIAARYDTGLAYLPGVEPLGLSPDVSHAYHLYVVRVAGDRDALFTALRGRNIGVNVHYIPTTLQPYYAAAGSCPVAEQAYQQILSLPMFPAMTEQDVDDVLTALGCVTG